MYINRNCLGKHFTLSDIHNRRKSSNSKIPSSIWNWDYTKQIWWPVDRINDVFSLNRPLLSNEHRVCWALQTYRQKDSNRSKNPTSWIIALDFKEQEIQLIGNLQLISYDLFNVIACFCRLVAIALSMFWSL